MWRYCWAYLTRKLRNIPLTGIFIMGQCWLTKINRICLNLLFLLIFLSFHWPICRHPHSAHSSLLYNFRYPIQTSKVKLVILCSFSFISATMTIQKQILSSIVVQDVDILRYSTSPNSWPMSTLTMFILNQKCLSISRKLNELIFY